MNVGGKRAVLGLVKLMGQPYSQMLDIELKGRENSEINKWFLASILYAKPIRESSATKTYKIFLREGKVSPEKIALTSWERLVELLDEGGYTRYDFSTADKLLEVFCNLQEWYEGDLNKVHESAADGKDLEKRLKELGKGIGDMTVAIFLRDMRSIWAKADPEPSQQAMLAASTFGIKDLKEFASENKLDIVELETALLRYAKRVLRPEGRTARRTRAFCKREDGKKRC